MNITQAFKQMKLQDSKKVYIDEYNFDYENESPESPDDEEWWKFKPAALQSSNIDKNAKYKLSMKLGILVKKDENRNWVLIGQMHNKKIVKAHKLPHQVQLFVDMAGIITPLNEFYDLFID